MDSKVSILIKHSDVLLERNKQIEHKLEQLGVKADKIKAAGYVKPRDYVRTEEARRLDEETKAAQEIAQELDEETQTAQAIDQEPILLDIDDDPNAMKQLLTEDQNIDINVDNQMDTDMKDIVDLLGEDEKETVSTESTKQERVERMCIKTGMDPGLLKYLQPTLQSQQSTTPAPKIIPQQTITQNIPQQSMTQNIEVINVDSEGNEIDRYLAVQPGQPIFQTSINPTQIQSGQPGQPIFESPITPTQIQTSQGVQPIIQITHSQQLPESFLKAPRSRTTIGAIPKEARTDPRKKFYCNRCPHSYTTRAELLRHQREKCLVTKQCYHCPKCLKGFFGKTGVKEHYFQEHLKTPLHRCLKCGKEFYFKAKKSTHKSGCPKKECADTYPDIPKNTQYDYLFVKNIVMVDTKEGDGNGGGSEVVEITEDLKDKPIDEPKSEVKDETKDEPLEKEEEKMEVTEETEDNLKTLATVASSEEKQ